MKLDLNKFYNSNYKDFVHKEAVEEALKLVPEVELKDVEIDNILSITFSVDEYGENPMYIEYIDKDGKTHLVRIRPAVSNEIQELLKRYVTLEQHETDKNAIYNHFETLNVPIELRSENALDEEGSSEVVLNNNNSFISFQVDPEIDNSIQWLCIHNKGGLGTQTQYFTRFVDFAKVDEVPSNADFAEKVQELEEKMNTADNHVLEASKQYSDSSITSLGDELNTKIEQTKNDLTVIIEEKTGGTLQQAKDYADTKDTEYFETSKRYTNNTKHEAINESKTYTDSKADETLDESIAYTDNKHGEVTRGLSELQDDVNTNYATKQELLTNVVGLNDYLNSYVQSLNDRIDGQATNIRNNTLKLSEISNTVKEYEHSNLNDKIKMLETMIATIGETTPIEMDIVYNGNSLELNNFSTYTTIGDTTIVNINCNFNAPFNSASIPILNTLNITSETLKSFPTFMIDCIVKTATNVSSYTTTTTFSNKITNLYVETPVIASNETIATTLVSFNGSFIFNNTSKESEE